MQALDIVLADGTSAQLFNTAVLKSFLMCYIEGTGTQPDYLVNHDEKKLRGRSRKKIAQKSRNSCRVNGQCCGCIGTVDSRHNFAQS